MRDVAQLGSRERPLCRSVVHAKPMVNRNFVGAIHESPAGERSLPLPSFCAIAKNLNQNKINLRLTKRAENDILKMPNKFNILTDIGVYFLSFGKNACSNSAYLYRFV